MKVIAKLSTRLFNSDAVRDAFFAGWVDAGGTKAIARGAPLGTGRIPFASNGMQTNPRRTASLTRRLRRIKLARLTGEQSAPKCSH